MGGVLQISTCPAEITISSSKEVSSPHDEIYSMLHGKNPADNFVRGVPESRYRENNEVGDTPCRYLHRKQQKSMSATGGEAPTVEVEVGQAWQGVDISRSIHARAPKGEHVAAGVVRGGGVDDEVIMVEEF